MKLLGMEITFARPKALTNAIDSMVGWYPILREAWAGAFQQAVTVDAPKNILAFSAVYACVTGIATDIAKLCLELKQDNNGIGICVYEVSPGSPYLAVLKKPNPYQTIFKFIEQWIVSKLLYGNTYILKRRDGRGMVIGLYIIDPQRVKVLVTDDGDIYYQISKDQLNGLGEQNVTVPASEMIHDMMVSLWHPLVGISPIYACALTATMGNKIQANSTKWFQNMSRISGALVSPGKLTDEVATKLKKDWEEGYSGANQGRVAVLAGGLEFKDFTQVSAVDAQVVDQLKWSVEDVARAFRYPAYKIGGAIPAHISVDALNQSYYTDCLQGLIESMEILLDEGLELKTGYYTEFDLEGLLRMDTAARLKAKGQAVKDGIFAPNEARAGEDLVPVAGGDSPYLQQQNFSLEALAKRDAMDDPFRSAQRASADGAPGNQGQDNFAAAAFAERVLRMIADRQQQTPALPAPAVEVEEDEIDPLAFAKELGIAEEELLIAE